MESYPSDYFIPVVVESYELTGKHTYLPMSITMGCILILLLFLVVLYKDLAPRPSQGDTVTSATSKLQISCGNYYPAVWFKWHSTLPFWLVCRGRWTSVFDWSQWAFNSWWWQGNLSWRWVTRQTFEFCCSYGLLISLHRVWRWANTSSPIFLGWNRALMSEFANIVISHLSIVIMHIQEAKPCA